MKIVRRTPHPQSQLADLHPVLQRIYSQRAITDNQQLNYQLDALLTDRDLHAMDRAVTRIAEAVTKQQHILIVGDYDADGATSTALALTALKQMGARTVTFLVPDRFKFGYGLSRAIVELAAQSKPDLIITVDNGIASVDGVAAANERGIDVVITDHHLPGEQLPAAYAIVNPNQMNDQFASKCLAGVGVIFYVMLALRRYLDEENWFTQQQLARPNMADFLDLVALGTVADVVPLDHNNRILVHQGLKRIRQSKARAGIQALINVAGREAAKITATDLGFALGPRLNAAGRLDDMSRGIQCLLAADEITALPLAQQLDQLNRERRHVEKNMQTEALEQLEDLLARTRQHYGICLYQPDWHEGVVGLIASRIKEKVHRPVIAFAKTEAGDLKGSARSIPALHIRDVLDEIASRYPDVIQKFGGHAMAAGLSLSEQNYARFCELFNDAVKTKLNADDLTHKIESDGELVPQEMTLEVAELLNQAGPWGQAFPEPVFDGVFEVTEQRIVGEKHLKLQLRHRDSHVRYDAIYFFVDTDAWPNHYCTAVRAVYQLDINEYQGWRRVQLILRHLEPYEGP